MTIDNLTFLGPEASKPAPRTTRSITEIAASINATEPTPEEVSAQFQASSPLHTVESQWVDLTQLRVDDSYQRGHVRTEIAYMASNWDPQAVGVLILSQRITEDGSKVLVILDGQQRTLSGLQAGHTDVVRALVHKNLTLAEEAELFLKLNKRVAVDAATRFKAAVVAGHEAETRVQTLLNAHGIPTSGARCFSAYTKALKLIERRNGEYHLNWALGMAKELFAAVEDGNVSPYDGRVLEALFLFHLKYDIPGAAAKDQLFTDAEFIRKMKGKTPNHLATRGQANKELNRGTIARNIAAALVFWYNAGRRTKGTKMLAPFPVVGGRSPIQSVADGGGLDELDLDADAPLADGGAE